MIPDDVFLASLEKSHEVAEVVRQALVRRGHQVRTLPNTVRPSSDERWEHTDDGDLEITLRVEVKHKTKVDFQSFDDFPFPDIITDEVYKVTREHAAKLYAYVIVNTSMTAAMVCGVWDRHHWFVRKIVDSRDGLVRDFYVCPKQYATFWQLDKQSLPR